MKVVVRDGALHPLEPLPANVHDGDEIEIIIRRSQLRRAGSVEFAQWCEAMAQLENMGSIEDELRLIDFIEHQRAEAKERINDDEGMLE